MHGEAIAARYTAAMAPATCPACQGALTEENFVNARVDVCAACGGIWFDRGELTCVDHKKKGAGPALQRALSVPAHPRAPRGALACPRCPNMLVGELHPQHPGVHVERCPTCDGIFLDGGELALLRERALTTLEASKARRRARRRRLRAKKETDQSALLIAIMLGASFD